MGQNTYKLVQDFSHQQYHLFFVAGFLVAINSMTTDFKTSSASDFVESEQELMGGDSSWDLPHERNILTPQVWE